MPRAPRLGKLSRGLVWGAAGIVALPIVLVALLLGALSMSVTRRPIVRTALDFANGVMGGWRIELDEAARLDPWGIELSGARLFDPQKHKWVSLRTASVRIAPWALIGGSLRITDARLSGGRVNIFELEAEPDEEEEDSAPSSFQIRVDRLRVTDTSLDMDLSGRALHALLEALDARGGYGPKTQVALQTLKLAVQLNGQPALSLATRFGEWDEKRGGKAALEGDVLGAHLSVVAEVPVIDAATPWPMKRLALDLTGVTAQGLARVGLDEFVQLRTTADLHVRAETRGARGELLSGDVALDAGAARLKLHAEASPQDYKLHAQLNPTQLASLSGVLPELRTGFELEAALGHTQKPMPLALAWRHVELDARAVPAGSLSASLALPKIELKQLKISGLEHALALRGSYDTSAGAAAVELQTHQLALARLVGLVPLGMDGVVDGAVRMRYAAGALAGQSDLSLRGFQLADTRIEQASLGLDISGTPSAPRGHVKLEAKGVKAGGNSFTRIWLDAHAGLRDLRGDLSADGPDAKLALALAGTRAADGLVTLDATGEGRIRDQRLGLELRRLKLGTGRYSVEDFSAFSGQQRVSLQGSLNAQHQLDAALSIAHLDISPWARLGLRQELTGVLDLKSKVQGTLTAPELSLELSLEGVCSAKTPRAPKVNVHTSASLDMRKHKAAVALAVQSLDRRVNLTLQADADLYKPTPSLVQAFERAQLKADLKAHADLPFLAQFAEAQLSELDGMLDAEIGVQGTFDAVALDARLGAELVPTEEKGKVPPDKIQLEAHLHEATLNATLALQDQWGKVIDLSAKVHLPAGGPRAFADDPQALSRAPGMLKLRLNERRLDKLQGTLGLFAAKYGFALPLRPAADVEAERDGAGVRAKVSARVHAWGEGLDATCAQGVAADASLELKLAADQLDARIELHPKGKGKVELDAHSPLLVNALLTGGAFAWGPASVELRGDDLALHEIPGLCHLPASRTRFALSLKELGKGPAQASLRLDIDDIVAEDTAPIGLYLTARAEPSAIKLDGHFKLAGNPHGELKAQLPLRYTGPVPQLPLDQPVELDLKLPSFPLSGLLAFTDAIGRPRGQVTADLHLRGTLLVPKPQGVIELRDAAFSVAALAQPFSDVDGRFELAPDKLIIRSLKARDRSGKLAVVGYARYSPSSGGQTEVHLSADKFPLRQQGSIIGELTTRAELKGKIDPKNKLSLDLEIKEGRIWLTGKGGQQVQELDEHPDIRFDTERDTEAERQAKALKDNDVELAAFRIRSERDLWIMHDDFSVQVGVDIKLVNAADGATLQGEATLTRGQLNLLGKPFSIDKGAIRFTGDVPPDPELDLKAKHTTRQGQTLNVQILGRASAPQIVFSGAANNAGEAAMLLSGIGNSGADSKAKGDAASFAAGLTAGLLAVSARRRFGDWVPMLAIENNASGAPSGARAGFDASRLIPKFMERFARGMYVEGVVGSRTDSASRGVGVGVRVDVSLPRDFMTSMGYGPGTVWSGDVYWSP